MTTTTTAKTVRGPRKWCDPPESFGKLRVSKRVWQRPQSPDPGVMAQYRAAVMQNAIAVHVRLYKNEALIRRSGLAAMDNRLDSHDLWDARLNGTENLTTLDIATLLVILPAAVPEPHFIQNFLRVAEGRGRPDNWPFPDT